jgi:signal transduction histidine kinase/DNA-binding response OmpR family regulator/streptogramin lyase
MRGLSQLDRSKQHFVTFTYRQGQPFEANHLLEDPSGDLWVASNVGLLRFDVKKKTLGLIAFPDSLGQIPSDRTVECLYMDGTGTIWMSLKVGGLCRFDPNTSHLSVVSQPWTFATTHISAILGDDQENLWLSTRRNGLIKFNPRTGKIRLYDQADGLQGNEFNRAFSKSPSGELYFGGNNGFNAFYPNSILDNLYAPPVVIRSFRVFDQPRNFSGNQITLPYSDNFFSFGFAALHYALPEKNRYAYRLEGVDKDWISAESRPEATYTNLDPGEYVLRVKASNNDGVWNEQGTWMKVTITPPWWRTPWAYGLYVLLLLGLLYAFRQYTLSQARLKNKLERKSLEAEKHQELNQLKTRFFTNVSHEFRTPLTLILNPLEDLLVEEAAESQKRAYYLLMHRNAKRLLGLINQLLDLSKLESGSLAIFLLPGNIIPFIQSSVASFVPMAQRQRIALQVHVTQQVLWVNFDHEKVEKILSNLLSNAFKFTPEGGAVTVNVIWKPKEGPSDSMPRLTIEVSDTGMGIPAEQLDKIFDRFYQIDHSSTRNVEGSGIGLALVKELVELHSGKITVNSQPGEGTCFTVTIPLEEVSGNACTDAWVDQHDASISLSLTEEYAGEEGSSDLSEAWDERTPLLLIVEDNADIRAYLRNTFDQAYRLVEAKDGVEGLSTAARILPDLIISDWMMPEMDGLAFCAQVKADEKTCHIPIIMLTAKADIQHKLQGLKNGADDYLVKPFHTEELIVRVQNLLTQRQKLRERFGRLFHESPPDHPAPPPQETAAVSLPPEDKLLSAIDAQFLQKLMAIVEAQLANPELNSSIIEREMALSRIQLYRKLKALTDQAPNDFIRSCRLKKAAELLSQRQFNVSQVAYQVGFTHLSYFTRCFRQAYGMTPSDYVASRTPQAE